MTEKPNCGNCDKALYCTNKRYNCACLEHPGAREYLMAPVIKEVEHRLNVACKLYHDTPQYLSTGNIYEAQRYVAEDILALIRDGVK